MSAIVIGVAVDVGGTLLVSGIVGVGLVIALLSQGAHPDEIEQRIADLHRTPQFLAGSLGLGLLFTLLGGFLAGWFGRHARLVHAGIVGAISTVVGVGLGLPSTAPDWYTALSLAGTVPAALLGGLLVPPPKQLADDAEDFYET